MKRLGDIRLTLAPILTALALSPARADGGPDPFDGAPARELSATADPIPQIGSLEEIDDRSWIVVKTSSREERTRAAALGLSIEEVAGATVEGIAASSDIRRLRGRGFAVLSETPLNAFMKAFPPADKDYHDYLATEAELAALAKSAKGLASLVSVGKSYKGLNITAIRFNTSATGEQASDKPGLLLMGTHHAREHLSTETPLLLAKWLAEHRDEPRVKRVLEARDVFIVPMVNPDGAEYDIATGRYRMQRKNVRNNGDGTIGVDLNRNYDSHWCQSGSSTYPGSETYCGPSAFSEPESQAVRAFVLARPNLRTMISYHTFDELILYPWSWSVESLPDAKALQAFRAMGKQMEQWTGYRSQQSAALYESSGDTCDWAWEAAKIFCFTYELGPRTASEGGFYPGPGLIDPTVKKNVQPMLYLAEIADDPYRAATSAIIAQR